ncbi:MAG: cytochrome C oxidase subunit IV family protein [Pirellulales bacterium]|nr:cytochrome C oxidase subunit IV family protein [Pirellulales bacterium]
MAHAAATDGHAGMIKHPPVGHVVPVSTLVGTWMALMALTLLTVGLAQFHLGPLDLISALAIATFKAMLVCLYFMHLRWDRPVLSIFFVGSLLFVALFLGLAMLDTGQYDPAVRSRQIVAPVDLQAAPDAQLDPMLKAAEKKAEAATEAAEAAAAPAPETPAEAAPAEAAPATAPPAEAPAETPPAGEAAPAAP